MLSQYLRPLENGNASIASFIIKVVKDQSYPTMAPSLAPFYSETAKG